MKFPRIPRTLAVSLCQLFLASALFGQTTYYFAGASLTQRRWNTSATSWTTSSSGTATIIWPNTASPLDNAIFASSDGSVFVGSITLSGAILVGDLTFSTTGYTIAAGTSPTLTATTISSSVASATIAAPVLLASGGSSFGGAGNLTVTGGVSSPSGSRTLTLATTGNVTISTTAIADGSGTVAVSHTGSGTTTLSAANTYTGGTTISAGALNVTGSLSSSGALTVDGGTITFSNNQTTTSLSGSGGTISLGSGRVLTANQGSTTSFAGSVSASGATLAKSGAGTLTLSGGNSVTLGTASVGGGTLSFAGPSSASVAAVQASGGGIVSLGQSTPFAGSSTTLSLDNGTLTLATDVTQTFASLALGNSGSNTINFGSTSASDLTFSSTPTGAGTVNVTNYNYTGDPNSSGPKLRVTGSPAEAIAFFTINNSPVTYFGGSDILVAIPEPSTYAAAAA